MPRDAQSESIETGLDQSWSTQAASSRGWLTPSVFFLGINAFLLQTLDLESGVFHSGEWCKVIYLCFIKLSKAIVVERLEEKQVNKIRQEALAEF